MKTKQRGLHRKCETMARRVSEQTEVFPKPHQGSGYWHLHLPVGQEFIHSTSTPFSVRRLCIQTLVNRAHHLAAIAPAGEAPTRVVVAVKLPELWKSQVIVFFGSKYFDTFFDRNTTTQRWSLLESTRSLSREWDLQIPDSFVERGYHEEINEPNFIYTGEIWFIGQLTEGCDYSRTTKSD